MMGSSKKSGNFMAIIFLLIELFKKNYPRGGGGYSYIFSVWGRAAEQGIIFRITTPGQGIIFVKIGSMTGSIFVSFDSERSF